VASSIWRAVGMGARIAPAVNQMEAHPLNQQGGLVAACRGMGVLVTAWSPLGRSSLYRSTPRTLLCIVPTNVKASHYCAVYKSVSVNTGVYARQPS
jgi:diketogulonate reductase-like aldo/keto reductase